MYLGDRWRTLRKLATPAFGYKKIESRILYSTKNVDNLILKLEEHFSTGTHHDKHLVENYIATCAVSIVIGVFLCVKLPNNVCVYLPNKLHIKIITYIYS